MGKRWLFIPQIQNINMPKQISTSGEELKEGTYTAKPSFERYYERVIDVQAKKIAFQSQELARMNNVYGQYARSTKILDAVKFLILVIHNKIKR
jgi:hypothetical protein